MSYHIIHHISGEFRKGFHPLIHAVWVLNNVPARTQNVLAEIEESERLLLQAGNNDEAWAMFNFSTFKFRNE